jgi:hypothetical protein
MVDDVAATSDTGEDIIAAFEQLFSGVRYQ